jgi:hypothetical protein
MNTDLAEPILTAASIAWERVFIHEVGNNLQTVFRSVSNALQEFHEKITGLLMRAGLFARFSASASQRDVIYLIVCIIL